MEQGHTKVKTVIHRISRLTGHMQSIGRMVEEGKDCSEILIQLSAIRAAVNNLGRIILRDHIDHCIVEAAEHGDHDAIANLNHAIDKFLR